MKIFSNWRLWTAVDVALAGLYFWTGPWWLGLVFVVFGVFNTAFGVFGDRVRAAVVRGMLPEPDDRTVTLSKGSVEPVETPTDDRPPSTWWTKHVESCEMCNAREKRD